MSEDYRWARTEERLRDLEQIARNVPVIQRDIAEIKVDVIEIRDEARELAGAAREEASTMKRGLYALAFSVIGGSVLFALSVFELFK